MNLTARDALATVVAALVALVYVANTQGWWYLGSNRWAAVTMLGVGAVGCTVGARVTEGKWSASMVGLGVLGTASLVLGIVAVLTGGQWALAALAIVLIALWVGTTLRHALTPPGRIAAR